MADVFREIPDKEQVAEWLKRIQILNFSDFHTFTERTFPFDAFNEILLEVEPYYFPCKARTYLHRDLTMKRVMTVLRQLVRPHGYTFLTHERLINGQKCYEYYLSPLVMVGPVSPLKVRHLDFD
jgi:hypothetical protein